MPRRGERGRQYSPEFKVEAVRLMAERIAAGQTLQRVSEELEIDPDLLRVWRKQVEDAPVEASAAQIFPGSGRRRVRGPARSAPAPARPESAEDEVQRLRRENERLRQERDFLKKAAAFFAKESR